MLVSFRSFSSVHLLVMHRKAKLHSAVERATGGWKHSEPRAGDLLGSAIAQVATEEERKCTGNPNKTLWRLVCVVNTQYSRKAAGVGRACRAY